MKVVFADTLFWVAIVRPNDPWARTAHDARKSLGPVMLVTTDEVLCEFLTALCKGGPNMRQIAVRMVRDILGDPHVHVVPQSRNSFLRGLERYERRSDKQYSLADCISMNVMESEGIRKVLTNDHHFAQEGFEVLINRKTD